MGKEAIISTESLNCYGTRVITNGINLEQYERNPILLYMHRRGRKEDMPIGILENLRIENNVLFGTPKFDEDTEDERLIAKKWERGTLRMLSAGLDVIEWSEDPALLVTGQTRPTVTKSKLIEVSVVDIGANDDALQVSLYHEGNLLTLAHGEESDALPLLKLDTEKNSPIPNVEQPEQNRKQPEQKTNINSMEKILLKLGLAPTATEDDAVTAITQLQERNESLSLARTTDIVDAAIKDHRITADKKDKYVGLGKQLGHDGLKAILDDIAPVQKPLELVNKKSGASASVDLSWATATPEQLEDLRENNRAEFNRLYKENFGFEPKFD